MGREATRITGVAKTKIWAADMPPPPDCVDVYLRSRQWIALTSIALNETSEVLPHNARWMQGVVHFREGQKQMPYFSFK